MSQRLEGRLENKVAMVTGGASGIGLAVVERFVAEGAAVVFCDLLPEQGTDENEKTGGQPLHHARRAVGGKNDGRAIEQRLGARAAFVAADVTDAAQVAKVVETATARFGGLDVIVNNAGIGTTEGTVTDVSEAVFQRTLDVNLKGAWHGMRAALPALQRRGGGSVINMASILGLRAWPGQSTYCATKGALIAMSRSVALEFASSRIRVNCVCPGIQLTPIYSDSPMGVPVDEERLAAHFARAQPIPRAGTPADIANAVLWLASDESTFVTGQSIVVDGGLDARLFSEMSHGDFMGGIFSLMAG